jgi:hypothetical protein
MRQFRSSGTGNPGGHRWGSGRAMNDMQAENLSQDRQEQRSDEQDNQRSCANQILQKSCPRPPRGIEYIVQHLPVPFHLRRSCPFVPT